MICQSKGVSIEQLFNTALQHHHNGNLAAAETQYRKILEQDPKHPGALHMYGLLALGYGNAETAIQLIGKAAGVAPDNGEIQFNLANAYFADDQLEKAVEGYLLALQRDATIENAYVNLGNAYFGLGRLDEAAKSYRKALAVDPGAVGALSNLGIVLERIGLYEEALTVTDQTLALASGDADVTYFRGVILEGLGRLEEAIAGFEAAIALDGDHLNAHFNLHGCLYGSGKGRERAIGHLETVLRIDPTDAKGRFYLGVLKDIMGDRVAAERQLAQLNSSDEEISDLWESWRYIQDLEYRDYQMFGTSFQILELGLKSAEVAGLVLEFGVRHGNSIRQIGAMTDQIVHGFDTFEGLPEDWHERPKGSYTAKGKLPEVPQNIRLHAGLFGDTLPEFLSKYSEPVRFMNIDCDLYSSTKTIFDHLANRIIPGTVIAFDEYLANPHWREDEFRAFQEAVRQNGWRSVILGSA